MSKETYDKGLKIRKEVLGAEFVENSFKNADEFSMPMQDLTTEYCWGYVWGREGLDKRTRSLLNLAMIATLNRPHELRLHIARRAAERRDARGDPRGLHAGGDLRAACRPASIRSARRKEVFAQIDQEVTLRPSVSWSRGPGG